MSDDPEDINPVSPSGETNLGIYRDGDWVDYVKEEMPVPDSTVAQEQSRVLTEAPFITSSEDFLTKAWEVVEYLELVGASSQYFTQSVQDFEKKLRQYQEEVSHSLFKNYTKIEQQNLSEDLDELPSVIDLLLSEDAPPSKKSSKNGIQHRHKQQFSSLAHAVGGAAISVGEALDALIYGQQELYFLAVKEKEQDIAKQIQLKIDHLYDKHTELEKGASAIEKAIHAGGKSPLKDLQEKDGSGYFRGRN